MRKTLPAPRRASRPSVPSSTTSTKPTRQADASSGRRPRGRLKVYASRCEKILKTLFLYHIAKMQPNGLSVEEIMNSVMEWSDHDKGQKADVKDNLDHYEVLARRTDQGTSAGQEGRQELRLHARRRRRRCQGPFPEGPQPRREQRSPCSGKPGISCSVWTAGKSRPRS